MTAVASCKLQVTSHKSQVTRHIKRRPVGRLVGCVPAVLIRPTENHRSLKEWLLVSCLLSLIFQPPTCTAHLYPLSFILYPLSFFLFPFSFFLFPLSCPIVSTKFEPHPNPIILLAFDFQTRQRERMLV